jgi:hypothetical protein
LYLYAKYLPKLAHELVRVHFDSIMSGDEAESDAGSAVSEGSRGSAVVFNADNDGVDADQDEDRVPDTYDGYTDAEYASIGWNAESRPTSTWKYEPKPGKYFPPEGGTNPEYLGLSPGELFMKIYGRPMDIWVYQTNLHAKHKYRLALRRAVADAALNGGPRRRVQAFRPITPREAKIWVRTSLVLQLHTLYSATQEMGCFKKNICSHQKG